MFDAISDKIKNFFLHYQVRPEQSFIIFQSYLASLFIGLFGIWRLITADYSLAIVDLSMVGGLLLLARYAAFDKYFRITTLSFTFIAIAGAWATFALAGAYHLFWSFPVVLVIFYILRIQDAFWASLVLLVGLVFLAKSLGVHMITFASAFLITVLYAFQFSYLMKSDNKRLAQEASRDPLTGAFNRRMLDDHLLAAIEKFQTQGVDSTLTLLDIDHFKSVNDDFGHDVGDVCLQRLVSLIKRLLPSNSQIYRFGGEEFCILTQADLSQGAALAETVRTKVEAAPIIRERPVTASFGVAALRPEDAPREWLHRVDACMYKAKHSGRNTVCVDSDSAKA